MPSIPRLLHCGIKAEHAKHIVDDNGGWHEAYSLSSGYYEEEKWTFASSTTVTVPSNATLRFRYGDRVKFTQSGTVKYFVIRNINATTLTLDGGATYTVANATITDIFTSKDITPLDFPYTFSWTPTFSANWGSVTINEADYFIMGNLYFCRVRLTGIGQGVAGSTVSFTLPISELNLTNTTCWVRDNSAVPVPGTISSLGAATVLVRKYDGTNFNVTGAALVVSGQFWYAADTSPI